MAAGMFIIYKLQLQFTIFYFFANQVLTFVVCFFRMGSNSSFQVEQKRTVILPPLVEYLPELIMFESRPQMIQQQPIAQPSAQVQSKYNHDLSLVLPTPLKEQQPSAQQTQQLFPEPKLNVIAQLPLIAQQQQAPLASYIAPLDQKTPLVNVKPLTALESFKQKHQQKHEHEHYLVFTKTKNDVCVKCDICKKPIFCGEMSASCIPCNYDECTECFWNRYQGRFGMVIMHDSVLTTSSGVGVDSNSMVDPLSAASGKIVANSVKAETETEVKFNVYHLVSVQEPHDIKFCPTYYKKPGDNSEPAPKDDALRKIASVGVNSHILSAFYESILKKHGGKSLDQEYANKLKEFMDFNFMCPIVVRRGGEFRYYMLEEKDKNIANKQYKYTSKYVNAKSFCVANYNSNPQVGPDTSVSQFEFTTKEGTYINKFVTLITSQKIQDSLFTHMLDDCDRKLRDWELCDSDEIAENLNNHKNNFATFSTKHSPSPSSSPSSSPRHARHHGHQHAETIGDCVDEGGAKAIRDYMEARFGAAKSVAL